jgi:hypothetical protein
MLPIRIQSCAISLTALCSCAFDHTPPPTNVETSTLEAKKKLLQLAEGAPGIRATFLSSEDCAITNPPLSLAGWDKPHVFHLEVTNAGNSQLAAGTHVDVAFLSSFPSQPVGNDIVIFLRPHEQPLETTCSDNPFSWEQSWGIEAPLEPTLVVSPADAMAVIASAPNPNPTPVSLQIYRADAGG